jgi:hypothetical protein
MRIPFAASLLVFGCTTLFSQTPAQEPAAPPAAASATTTAAEKAAPASAAAGTPALLPEFEDTDMGFRYSLPADWEVVAPPPVPKVTVPYPTLAAPKKGDACVEVVLTAKHGTPASVVVVTALPFACYGQNMKAGDLKNFGAGAAEGMKQTFEVTEPVEANYSLGTHAVWIERAKGTPKHHPENPFTFEIACTVLEKGAACWMTIAADAASLQAFEQGTVSLDGEVPAALVPATAFPNKP